ncbi:polysaccharide deacetylase [Kribbella flavida DSM 17836]|uniref:Polysaccharide deacetylase n=1 Tax=Kribbella flavida (strain DSM 17836 / JCM 10339 / NBRC 14399) TaxID=479435 RepID=D2Q4Q6_KRIFD|nr:polysaccharide deacetylase family protein [Kribbella flavida]ADB34161.1 polysaccharide deacetylase [Kribbella flavida DSM 17836]
MRHPPARRPHHPAHDSPPPEQDLAPPSGRPAPSSFRPLPPDGSARLPGWRGDQWGRVSAPIVLAVSALVIGMIAALGAGDRQPAPAVHAAAPPPPAKYVVLTFDDGPDPRYTPRILDILDQYEAKATFFAVGTEVARHPALTRSLHDRGHSVQNHTWSHPDLRRLSAAAFDRQIRSTDEQIHAHTGTTPRCLRPPYGAQNPVVVQRAAGLGKQLVLWDVDSRDWDRPGTAAIVRRVVTGARHGSVVLFHDGGGNRAQTVAALPTILKTLKAKGFGFRATRCEGPS